MADAGKRTLRIGTRGSGLAMFQTRLVADLLKSRHPEMEFDIRVISTQGDRDKETPLSIIGGQGIFAKELEAAILSGEIDCAVHSLKDLTSILPDNLMLAAILDREDPRDVLITRHAGGLRHLPKGARVGTSSRRRIVELLEVRPDLTTVELRGNIDTRISKVLDETNGYDAAILAAAGLRRMERDDVELEYLDVSTFTPAPGQAALGVECREDDLATRAVLATIHDADVALATGVERAFLRGIGGGCRSPIGAFAELQTDGVRLRGMVADESLTRVERIDTVLDAENASADAEQLARDLLVKLSE